MRWLASSVCGAALASSILVALSVAGSHEDALTKNDHSSNDILCPTSVLTSSLLQSHKVALAQSTVGELAAESFAPHLTKREVSLLHRVIEHGAHGQHNSLPELASIQAHPVLVGSVVVVVVFLVWGICLVSTRPKRESSESVQRATSERAPVEASDRPPKTTTTTSKESKRKLQSETSSAGLPDLAGGKQEELLISRRRLIMHEELWELAETCVEEFTQSSLSVIPEQSPVRSLEKWKASQWQLMEKPRSLHLNKACIASWSSVTNHNQLYVEQLAAVTLSAETQTSPSKSQSKSKSKRSKKKVKYAEEEDKLTDKETIDIAENVKEPPKRLHAFLVKWYDDSWNSKVLAVKSEDRCSRWVTALSEYASILKWYESGDMWKLNSDVLVDLPQESLAESDTLSGLIEDSVDLPSEALADIENWRRRIFRLQQCKVNGLCLVYASELENCEQKVLSILTHYGRDGQAKITTHRPVFLNFRLPSSGLTSEHAKAPQRTYMLAMGCLEDELPPMPDKLYPFEIEWVDDNDETRRSFVACGSEVERTLWIDKMKNEMEALLQVDV